LIVGVPLLVAQLLMLAGSLVLVAIFAAIIRRHPALYTFTMGGGAHSLGVGQSALVSRVARLSGRLLVGGVSRGDHCR
jgi:hypothetical protein